MGGLGVKVQHFPLTLLVVLSHYRVSMIITVPARVVPQHGCVGRHLVNRNEVRVSGSDSYALLFLFS